MRSLYGDATSTAVTCGHLLPFVLSWSDDLSGGLVTFDFLSKQSVLLDNIGKGSGRSAVASEAVTRDVLVVKRVYFTSISDRWWCPSELPMTVTGIVFSRQVPRILWSTFARGQLPNLCCQPQE